MADTVEDRLNALIARVAKVRRWMVALAILKVLALCLIFVSGYIAVYAWLDHRLNFGALERIVAFGLLLAGVALLLWKLANSLLAHVSHSRAASHIEDRMSFDQQLVTAVEYYENRKDYPYSRALAEQLVLNIDRDSAGFKFGETVEKWRGYVFAVIILAGSATVGYFVHDNYVYFASYFARLVRPLAVVEPVKVETTGVKSITKDIVAEPGSTVTFAAEIEGRAPESARLVIVPAEAAATATAADLALERMEIEPSSDGQGKSKLELSRSFPDTGQYKYRFEADSASTDWHDLSVCHAPDIKGVEATVSPPKTSPRTQGLRPYTEQIENQSLEVVRGSEVTLSVQTTEPLRQATITGPDGQRVTKQLDGADQFTFSLTATKEGAVEFDLVGERGLPSNELPDLQVTVKTDEPPMFKLLSPDGDYLATDVASVPITFEVTDDFGLDTVEMVVEIPGRAPKKMQMRVPEGARSEQLTQTLELEQYDLNVGDSILFYAGATDIDTGLGPGPRTSSSDVYFVEIGPYRQYWHPKPGGGSGNSGGAAIDSLLDILEYTRAILKKTWAIANIAEPTEQDHSRLEFINNDVRYCAHHLAAIRDDSECGFGERDKAVLNQVLEHYEQASGHLSRHDASSAIQPEKNAYQILRKFVIELEKEWAPPPSGGGQQAPKPDSVKLEQRPEMSGYEKERIESELKNLQQKLDKLTQAQKSLKIDLVNYLEQQDKREESGQKSRDALSASTEPQERGRDKSGSERQDRGGAAQSRENAPARGSGSDGEGDSAARQADEGRGTTQSQDGSLSQGAAQSKAAAKGQSPSQGQSSSAGQTGSAGQSASQVQSAGKGGSSPGGRGTGGDGGQPVRPVSSRSQSRSGQSVAGAEAILKMLQAKQGALQEKTSQLKQALQRLPESSQGEGTSGRGEAQKRLSSAISKMDEARAKLSEARYRADTKQGGTATTVELMDSAREELDLAERALGGELTLSATEEMAKKAQEMAEQLAADADALDESVTPVERQQMAARLQAAKRLLDSMLGPQWSTVDQGNRGTSSGAAHVFTKDRHSAVADAARETARQFWSIVINAKKHSGRLIEDEPADAEFYELQNEFFENAARFNPQRTEK